MWWYILVLIAIALAQAVVIVSLKKQVNWLWRYVAGEHDSVGRIVRMGIYDWVKMSMFKSGADGSTGDPDGIKPPSAPPPW